MSDKIRSDRCIDLFRKIGDKGHIGKDLRKVSLDILNEFPCLNPESRICTSCRKKFSAFKKPDNLLESNPSHLDDSQSTNNDSLLSNSSLNLDSNVEPEIRDRSQREIDLEEMLDNLKIKFSSLKANDPLKIRILTLAPSSWSSRKIAREFNTSRRSAEKSKNLKSAAGVLGETVAKAGHGLAQNIIVKIDEFYNNDMYSRMMPSTKDVISVKNKDGSREDKRRRLLLLSLRELYISFKEAHSDVKVSFSKFASLRPKYCILPGASGTHSVCVCTIHQNVKLMLDAINIKNVTKNTNVPLTDYKDCIAKMICSEPKSDCYLDKCEKCPGTRSIISLLRKQLDDACITHVKCSLWVSTDRATLLTQSLSIEDFLLELDSKLTTLKVHSYIAKQQGNFINEKKKNLEKNEAFVMFDFSENYAYVCQDASQAFHFNNDQCTVVPVIFYYKDDDDELKHQSLVILSDCLKHDTVAVYAIQTLLIPEIKKKVKKLKKIYYNTDGAKQHFKNKFQISNLISHEKDFKIQAEWHFTATAHGKSMYDGVGATFKRAACRASLTAKPSESILTPDALFNWAKNHFKTITILYFDKIFHNKMKKKLNYRFNNCKSVPEISKCHGFIVQKDGNVLIKRLSNDTKKNANLWSPG